MQPYSAWKRLNPLKYPASQRSIVDPFFLREVETMNSVDLSCLILAMDNDRVFPNGVFGTGTLAIIEPLSVPSSIPR